MSNGFSKKSYLFVHNSQVGDREAVKKALDQMIHVETWRYDMPNVFYIVSVATADTLANEFEKFAGSNGRYIFLEYSSNSQGRLTGDTWHLLNNLEHTPQRQAKLKQ